MTSDDAPTVWDESTAESNVPTGLERGELSQPSIAVVEAVAAATDRDPRALPPLYERLDGDALDALVAPRADGTSGAISVSFSYEGVDIRLDSGGRIEILPDGGDLD